MRKTIAVEEAVGGAYCRMQCFFRLVAGGCHDGFMVVEADCVQNKVVDKGTKEDEAEWLRKGIRLYTASIGHMNELLDITRKYTLEYLGHPQEKYEKRKQLVEEFWLKAGGLMKYMTAMGFEKDTIMFFLEMREFVPEGERKYIQACIDEERTHLRLLAGMLRK